MKLRVRLLSLMLDVMLVSGCAGFLSPPPTPTVPAPTFTAIPTRTPLPTQTLTPTPTVTPVFASYPLKHVLFKYVLSGNASVFDEFGLYEETMLVIYSDGQVIASRAGDKRIRTKYLTTGEVCYFVNKLDSYGFFTIDAPQNTDETNPLYDFGSKYQKVYDGSFRSLVLNGMSPRRVSLYEPYKDFLVRPMKRMLDFVETYNPGGLKDYQPERMLLFVESGRGGLEAQQVKTEAWGADLPSLRSGNADHIFLEGEEAGQVYDFLLNSKANIFTEGNAEYTVVQRMLYPHESLDMTPEPIATPTDFLLPINCNP
ncbi:MAG: hypothetical protein JNK32_11635 [Anaerolineales bacterium]|nr:hypothetical protein [Anaerolineales bacterium]